MALGDVLRLLGRRDVLLFMAGSWTAFSNLYVSFTVLPLYVLDVGGTAADVGWQAGLFTVASIVLRAVLGPLADRRGRRLPLVVGSAAYGLACLGLVYADSVGTVALMRVVQAVGSAAFLSAASAMTIDLSPPGLRATGLGLLGVFKALALGLGPPLALVTAGRYGFSTLFFAGALVSAAGTLSLALVRESAAPPASQAGALPPPAPPPPRRAAGEVSSVNGAAPRSGSQWVVVVGEPRARQALLSMAVVSAAYGAVMNFVPVYGEAAGVHYTGLYFPVMAGASLAGGLVAGRAADGRGRMAVFMPVLALLGLGVGAAGALAVPVAFTFSALLVGQGFAGGFAVLGALLAESVGPRQRGLAFALQETAIDAGMALGALAIGSAAAGLGYGPAFAGVGTVCLLWSGWLWVKASRQEPVPGVASGRSEP